MLICEEGLSIRFVPDIGRSVKVSFDTVASFNMGKSLHMQILTKLHFLVGERDLTVEDLGVFCHFYLQTNRDMAVLPVQATRGMMRAAQDVTGSKHIYNTMVYYCLRLADELSTG